jgi:hypothetical protein
MKAIRYWILAGIATASFCATRSVWAQASAVPPPVVVVPRSDSAASNLPKDVKTLISNFARERDKYLAEQDALLIKLKNATTAAEREQIRAQLQANRQAFLAALKAFRLRLKDELTALKGKISHEEFLRIIDAAHNVTTEGGIGHHKGH